MELWTYTLPGLVPQGILDLFDSLRVVTRYDEPGEIELTLPIADAVPPAPGLLLWPSGFQEAFLLETVRLDASGPIPTLACAGRSAAALLARRCIPDAPLLEGPASEIARALLEQVLADPARAFSSLTLEIPQDLGPALCWQAPPLSLLDAVQDVCLASGLGLRTRFQPLLPRGLSLELYQGTDHTGPDAALPVTFSARLDNIARMRWLDSTADQANVAFVQGSGASLTYDPEAASGYARFETLVPYRKSDDALETTAQAALAKRRRAARLWGEVDAAAPSYALGRDYALGDIVRVQHAPWGVETTGRIREIEETWHQGAHTTALTIGEDLPTLLDKIKRLS
jgi:hypothetical protein